MENQKDGNNGEPDDDDPFAMPTAIASVGSGAGDYVQASEQPPAQAGSPGNPIHIHDPDLAVWSRRLVYWTGGIVFATLVSAVISWFQWAELQKSGKLTQGQLNEMRNQRLLTITQLRATIRREEPVVHTMTVGQREAKQGDVIVGWEINPWWTNAGSTAAKNFVSWSSIEHITAPPTVNDLGTIDCPVPHRSQKVVPGVIEHGGQRAELAKSFSVEDVKKVLNRTEIYFLAGHAEYSDVFPGTPLHHHDWCVIIMPNDPDNSRFSFLIVREETD